MKNKVQVSTLLKKNFLLLMIGSGWLLPQQTIAQTKPVDSSAVVKTRTAGELKIKQRGTDLYIQFPRTDFRSALKLINTNGSVLKGVMIDEGVETITVSVIGLPKGIYQCLLENRTQRYSKKILLQ
ncbi:MAG: hypothetical protein K2Q24_06025 [Chitinophagaceae bacterium]|nr:hypothetical protein [Chitinophagaceae bacterium]